MIYRGLVIFCANVEQSCVQQYLPASGSKAPQAIARDNYTLQVKSFKWVREKRKGGLRSVICDSVSISGSDEQRVINNASVKGTTANEGTVS